MTKKNFTPPVSYNAHFMLTNFCNAFCAHCLVDANPLEQKRFMPFSDIIYYLDEFDKDSNFTRRVGFNGGEALMEYKHNSPSYFSNLLQECIRRNYDVHIKTNALWAEDASIKDIIWKSFDNLDFTGFNRKISIGLSVDMFHNNESANQKIISRICKSDLKNFLDLSAYVIPDDNTVTDDKVVYGRLTSLLSNEFIEENKIVVSGVNIKDIPPQFNFGLELNGVKFLVEAHSLGGWGRARKMGIGSATDDKHLVSSNFHIASYKHKTSDNPKKSDCLNNVEISDIRGINIVFSSDGTADFIVPVEKITNGVTYHANGLLKPWRQLYPEMINNMAKRFAVVKQKYPALISEIQDPSKILELLSSKSR